MEEYSNLNLVYVNPIGKNSSDLFEYEFFFSDTPDVVWADGWNENCPSACGDLRPDDSTYSVIKRLITNIPFFCVQENSCYSLQDCIDGCVAVAHEDISDYDDYPEPYRIVFKYGEEYDSVINKLKSRDCSFEE